MAKEYKRKARNFSCALDRFASMETLRMNRSFENDESAWEQGWYFTYLDELEKMLKTTEKQLASFFIDI